MSVMNFKPKWDIHILEKRDAYLENEISRHKFGTMNVVKYTALEAHFDYKNRVERRIDDNRVEVIHKFMASDMVVNCLMIKYLRYDWWRELSNKLVCALNKDKVSEYYIDIEHNYQDVLDVLKDDTSVYCILRFSPHDKQDKAMIKAAFYSAGFEEFDECVPEYMLVYYKKN